MVLDFVLTSPKLLPFYENFPRNMVCWQFVRKALHDSATISESLHRVLVVDVAMGSWLLALATFEWDAFRYRSVRRLLRKEASSH